MELLMGYLCYAGFAIGGVLGLLAVVAVAIEIIDRDF